MGATLSYITPCPRWLCRCDLARCPFAQLGNLRSTLSDVRQPSRALSSLPDVHPRIIFGHLVSNFDILLAFLSLFRSGSWTLRFHFVTLNRLFHSLIVLDYGKR